MVSANPTSEPRDPRPERGTSPSGHPAAPGGAIGPPPSRIRLPAKLAAITLLVFLAFGIRSLLFRDVVRGDRTYFFDTDPYYHMRRIVLTLADYPHVPVFDAYVNFPGGALINWPGGFDLLLATLVRVIAPVGASPVAVDRICAWSIPVLGALTVATIFLVARQFFSFSNALFAAFLLCFSGAHVLVSRIGRVDHHVLEVLLPALALLFYLRALALKPSTLSWGAMLALAGLSFAMSFTVWTGSIMFLGMFILYAFVCQASSIWKGHVQDPVSRGAQIVLFTASFALLPLCATSPWGRKGEILYLALSWFQFLVPFYSAIALTLADLARSRFTRNRWGFLTYTIFVLAVAAALFALTVFIQPRTVDTLRDTWEFMTRKEPQIHSVGESQSIWVANGEKRGYLYGPLFGLLPLLAVYALIRPFLARGGGPKYGLLFLWFLTTGTLAALQIRFAPACALPLALYWTLLLADVQGLAKRAGERRGRRRVYAWIPLPLYLCLGFATFASALNQPRQTGFPRFLATFYDIERVTPPTSYLLDPGKKPEYGILAHWPWGHHLNYLSHRPNIANPFGQAGWYLQGVRDSYRFLLLQDESRAVDLSRRLQARYILVSSLNGHVPSFARYRALLFPDDLVLGDPIADLMRVYPCIMNNRMILFDGLSMEKEGECPSAEPLGHSRLVYESEIRSVDDVTREETSTFKLFERVQGVHILGKAGPHDKITVSVPVRTNQGREFIYLQSLRANDEGRFETRIPYATQCTLPSGLSTGPGSIAATRAKIELEIPEDDVQNGSTLAVDLSAPR